MSGIGITAGFFGIYAPGVCCFLSHWIMVSVSCPSVIVITTVMGVLFLPVRQSAPVSLMFSFWIWFLISASKRCFFTLQYVISEKLKLHYVRVSVLCHSETYSWLQPCFCYFVKHYYQPVFHFFFSSQLFLSHHILEYAENFVCHNCHLSSASLLDSQLHWEVVQLLAFCDWLACFICHWYQITQHHSFICHWYRRSQHHGLICHWYKRTQDQYWILHCFLICCLGSIHLRIGRTTAGLLFLCFVHFWIL